MPFHSPSYSNMYSRPERQDGAKVPTQSASLSPTHAGPQRTPRRGPCAQNQAPPLSTARCGLKKVLKKKKKHVTQQVQGVLLPPTPLPPAHHTHASSPCANHGVLTCLRSPYRELLPVRSGVDNSRLTPKPAFLF